MRLPVLAAAGALAAALTLTLTAGPPAAAARPAGPTEQPAAASGSAVTAGTGARPCDRPRATRPPRRGTVAYNAWLGRTFTSVLLNTPSEREQRAILDRIVAVDYVQHNPLVAEGRQGLVDFLPVIRQAFPDACFVLRDVFATRDRVVTRWTWTGTLTGGPFLGVPARGQQVEFDAIDIWTVRAGQLYEHWDQFDWTRAIVQLGERQVPDPFVQVANQPVDR